MTANPFTTVILGVRIFAAIVIPLYAGYVGYPIWAFALYLLLLGVCWHLPTEWRFLDFKEDIRDVAFLVVITILLIFPTVGALYAIGRGIHALLN
jgi:hypothetical protein